MTLHFRSTATGATRAAVTADMVIACDGVNSAVRRQFYPGEELCFGGINTWRGVTRAKPFLTGRSYVRIGSIQSGNLVIYPIVDDVDGQGQQLINWTAQVAQPGYERNDWNKPGRLEDFLPIFAGWTFDWLDVPDLLRRSDVIFEYPMVDREPVDRWTFGRVTLLGDAAHPMYPRGSNGAGQAILDARTLTGCLVRNRETETALKEYEQTRLKATNDLVLLNRTEPPDTMLREVHRRTGDKPFARIEDVIAKEELAALSENYKRVAGFERDSLARRASLV